MFPSYLQLDAFEPLQPWPPISLISLVLVRRVLASLLNLVADVFLQSRIA